MNRIQIIEEFYQAFHKRDYEGMNAHYAPKVRFHDPAFRELRDDEPRAMWHMLCAAARDLSIECSNIRESGNKVTATWQAHYNFSATGRRVHNIIDAEFTFQDDKITEHIDRFNMYKWTRMALGVPGVLLGWTPFLKNKISTQARNNLVKFIQENDQYKISSLTD